MLVSSAEARKQREDFDAVGTVRVALVGDKAVAQVFLEGGGGFNDVALAGKEHQDVAAALPKQFVNGVGEGGFYVNVVAEAVAVGSELPGVWLRVQGGAQGKGGLIWCLGVLVPWRGSVGRGKVGGQWTVADLDGVSTTGNLNNRDRLPTLLLKVVGKALGINGGRSDDDLEVAALGEQSAQVAQDEVNVEASLVSLIHNDRVIAAKKGIGGHFSQQDAVGH